MSVAAPPRSAFEIDDGVIERARRRQRRRRRAAAAGALLVALGATLALALAQGQGGNAPATALQREPPLKLTFVRGKPYVNGYPLVLSVLPYLQAGQVGLCERLEFAEDCGPYATTGTPLVGHEGVNPVERVGRRGEILVLLAAPAVSAVRVSRLGTIHPLALPGLPAGDRAVIVYRPPGAIGTVLPPDGTVKQLQGFEAVPHPVGVTLTPLGRDGRALPQISAESPARSFTLPVSYWQAPSAESARGRCALQAPAGASLRWGEAATRIAPDATAPAGTYLTCLDAWYASGRSSVEVAVLLDARAPGRARPLPLWDARPLAGHPGVFALPASYRRPFSARSLAISGARHVRLSREIVPETLLRREGDAWLLVRYDASLSQRLAFLDALRLSRSP